MTAFIPIQRGLRVTVKDAISDYGISGRDTAISVLIKGKLFSGPIRLSLRNALRRRTRFWLNCSILAFSGALFVAVVTSMLSVQATLDNHLDTLKYDYQIVTNTSADDPKLTQAMAAIPEIRTYESWGSGTGKLVHREGQTGSLYSIFGVPNHTAMSVQGETGFCS